MVSSAHKLVIKNIGLMLSGALEKPSKIFLRNIKNLFVPETQEEQPLGNLPYG